ncbi:MAG: DnaA/Hda family protein [Longimicrobiales bacterium]|nr:DnaA/Hda family protein [Longimicrobiales bacterium]
MPFQLDPRFTFEAFVVGPANRLAVAAAERVADAPGTTYNPLFIYSASGLGKTHLLTAIGHRARKLHDVPVVYETLEHLMGEISAALAAGEQDAFRSRLHEAGILLLDDVQFLAGQRQTQEELIRTWDALASKGAQVVLTSDRPPQEIDALDDRLLERLSGGLIVDVSAPDYETRVAIARRKAEERGRSLSMDVCEAVGRIAFTNVRELQGALNRLIAVEELEGRTVKPGEVDAILGAAASRGRDEFGEFLSDISGTVSAVVEEADRRIADAILQWEGEGYQTRRLDRALESSLSLAQAEELVRRFEHDVGRLRRIAEEIRTLDPQADEMESPILADPDRVAEAEALLATVRERRRPPPGPPPGPGLDVLDGELLAVRAARAVADGPGSTYNPLYVMGPEGAGKSTLLGALGNELRAKGLTVAYLSADTFAEELIAALERSRLDAWRTRFRQVDVLVLDGLEAFARMERAQEELFHLFEELHRAGRQLVFAAVRAPQDLAIPERLRSRLEGGLVVELDPDEPVRAVGEPTRSMEAVSAPHIPGAAGAEPDGGGAAEEEAAEELAGAASDTEAYQWILSREKVLWEWPYAGDWIEEELD